MKNLVLRVEFDVPIFNVAFLLVVAHDAVRAYRTYSKRFNDKEPEEENFDALCINHEGCFGLFFHAATISEELLTHEIDHARDDVLEHIGHTCIKCYEPRALLAGHLSKVIHELLRKHKVTIN